MTKTKTIRGKKVSFKKYLEWGLSRGAFGDSPEGDFARDAVNDQSFRDDFERWESLEMYLGIRKACPEAMTSAKTLFKRWRAGQ